MGSRYTSPIRFRPDTGWEYRCASCADKDMQRFWPLTDEFWDAKRGMIHCRACWREIDAFYQRERVRNNPEAVKAARRERVRRYRRENREAQRIIDRLRWQQIKSDPVRLERARARAREAQRRYRARQAEARAA